MEQKSPNWKNLNVMYYWKYVMKKGDRTIPEVRFIDYPINSEEIVKMAFDNPDIHFTVESEHNPGSLLVAQNNVDYTWRSGMSPERRLERLNATDYVVCKDKYRGVEAGLCGTTVFENVEDLPLQELKVLNSVERIINWEKTKSILTEV